MQQKIHIKKIYSCSGKKEQVSQKVMLVWILALENDAKLFLFPECSAQWFFSLSSSTFLAKSVLNLHEGFVLRITQISVKTQWLSHPYFFLFCFLSLRFCWVCNWMWHVQVDPVSWLVLCWGFTQNGAFQRTGKWEMSDISVHWGGSHPLRFCRLTSQNRSTMPFKLWGKTKTFCQIYFNYEYEILGLQDF